MTTDTASRKRGGQPGNQNARRHGLYSAHFHPTELGALDQLDQATSLDHEINMLRIATRRLFEIASAADDESELDTSLATLNALGAAAIRISSLLQAQQRISGQSNDINSALSAALASVTKELGIR